MIILLLLIVFSIFIYKNSLYYTISLLIISFTVLGFLTLNTYMSFLTSFMLIIVYVGAIMVLIGYICAIRPNLLLEPDYSILYFFFIYLLLTFFFSSYNSSMFNISTRTIVDYFYSYQGIFIFFTLVFILFITLLIVTSQYSVPKGPFRSAKI